MTAPSPLPIAAVVGATGTQGISVTRALAAAGYQVRALTRDTTSPKALKRFAGLENVIPWYFDVEKKETIAPAFKGAKVVYALSNPDLVAVLEPPGSTVKSLALNETEQGTVMADVALAEGVEIFVWSTTPSAIEQSKGKYTTLTLFNEKIAVEEYIKSIGLPAFFPQLGGFSDNHVNYERCHIADNGDIIYELANPPALDASRWPQISIEHDLGTIILKLIENFYTDNLLYKHFRVAERYYSLNEMVGAVAKVTGRKVIFKALPVWGASGSTYDMMFKYNADPDVMFYPDDGTFPDPALKKYGIKFQTFEEYVRQYLAPHLGLPVVG